MSSTTSQTSTTISAHIDFGAADTVIPTAQPAPHIAAVSPHFAAPITRIHTIEFRTLDSEDGENVSADLRAFWDLRQLHMDNGDSDIIAVETERHEESRTKAVRPSAAESQPKM